MFYLSSRTEETEAQGDEATWPGWRSQGTARVGLELGSGAPVRSEGVDVRHLRGGLGWAPVLPQPSAVRRLGGRRCLGPSVSCPALGPSARGGVWDTRLACFPPSSLTPDRRPARANLPRPGARGLPVSRGLGPRPVADRRLRRARGPASPSGSEPV